MDFQFEVGKTYELPEGQIPELCVRGFHFCRVPISCDGYYPLSNYPRHALIKAWDVIDEHIGTKSVCRKIEIVEEISSDQWGKIEGIFTDPLGTYHVMNSKYHREDGPAMEYSDGTKEWCRNGQCHREDGPAIEYSNGTKEWYRNGQHHREDGPAIEYSNGYKAWYRNGQLHREDGPAMELSDGTKRWYRNGQMDTRRP
jgi:hypothetical protein